MSEETTSAEVVEETAREDFADQVIAEQFGAGSSEQPQEAPPPTEEPVVEEKPHAEIFALLDKAAADRAKRADRDSWKTEKQTLEAQVAELNEKLNLVTSDPARFYETPEERRRVAGDLVYENMGDEAPADFKQQREMNELRKKLADYDKRFEEQEEKSQKAQHMQYLREYGGRLTSFVEGGPSEAPILSQAFSENREATQRVLFNTAEQLGDELGTEPSPLQVAQYIEAQYDAFLALAERARSKSKPAPAAQPETQQGLPTNPTNESLTGATKASHESAEDAAARERDAAFDAYVEEMFG